MSICAQGRARPSLAKLYNWRYEDLGDLPYVKTAPQFLRANPGFAHEFQFINVPDYQGRGESEPVPYFYQVGCNSLLRARSGSPSINRHYLMGVQMVNASVWLVLVACMW